MMVEWGGLHGAARLFTKRQQETTDMSQIKNSIASIRDLHENTNIPLINLMRPWMAITGLSFKDALHLTHLDLVEGLVRVHARLGDSLDIFDEDQLQEAACRCLKKITVYGEMITDGEFAVHRGQDIEWGGSSWVFISDPKLRMRETSMSYREALKAVQERLGV
jgi:hypothetical protein